MLISKIAFAVYIAIGLVYWLAQAYRLFRNMNSMQLLAKTATHELERWPKVSVIITACNEERILEKALQTRLDDDYPNLEIIVIDDRSTDRTGEIVDRFALQDKRVRAVHIKELPEGWLGKTHALHQGVLKASGDWYLFSDGDVYIGKTTLRRAIGFCERNTYDHLAVIPELMSAGLLVDCILAIFMRMLCVAVRMWKLDDPMTDDALGAGAFNLARRTAFEQTSGFQALRRVVADDVMLGKILKKSGARPAVMNGRDCVRVPFYRSLNDAAVGSERAVFASLGNFSLVQLIVVAFVLLALELSGFIALFAGGALFLQIVGVVIILLVVMISVTASAWLRCSLWAALLQPLGVIIMAVLMVRAGIVGVRRGGINWRGTFYSTDMLKKSKQL